MECLKWIFDGIGAQIIGIVVGLIFGGIGGGIIGYRVGNKNKSKQNQKAKDDAVQSQIGNITINNNGDLKNGKS